MSDFDDDFEIQPDDDRDDTHGIPRDIFDQVISAFTEAGRDFDADSFIGFAALEQPDDLRGYVFASAEDAFNFLESIGVDDFSEVVWLDDDYWGVAIHDSP